MGKVSRSQEYDVSAADMWKKIGDFQGLAAWHPMIEASSPLEGGKVRSLTIAGGVTVTERLTDEGDMSYSYTFVECPLPITNYNSTLKVSPKGAGCVVDWEGTFDPVGIPEEDAAGMVGGIYEAGLGAI